MRDLLESRPDIYPRIVPIVCEAEEKTPKINEKRANQRQRKMEILEDISNSVSPLKQRIEEATGCFEDKEYLQLQDQLEKSHIALDNVEAEGDEEIRKKRKSIVVAVSNILKMLDSKAKKFSKDLHVKGSIEFEKVEHNNDQKVREPDNGFGMSDDCKNHKPSYDHEADVTELNINTDQARNETLLKKSQNIPEIKIETIHNDHEEQEHSCNSRVIPIIQEGKTINKFDTKQVIRDNSRVQMKVFDNCVNLVVHVKDLVKDDLEVRFEDDELVVTGRNEDGTLVMSKTVPSDCLYSRAISQLTSDGILMVKVPRRKSLHPFQMRGHPLWF